MSRLEGRTVGRYFFTLLIAATFCLGCEHSYSWNDAPPPVQGTVRDQSCGENLVGVAAWSEVDSGDYTDMCGLTWEIFGTLADGIDASCASCRCQYDAEMSLTSDTCGWYEDGTSFYVRFGFVPTVSGPSDYTHIADDWPWLGYTDLKASWSSNDAPEPTDDMGFVYRVRHDENALTGDYDVEEFYLSAYYWGWAPDGVNYVENTARIGLTH